MNEFDDIALAEIRADIVDLRQRDARDARDTRAEPEGERVDAAGADAHRGRHSPVLRDRAHLEAEAREAQQPEQEHEDTEREADDPEPAIGDVDRSEVEGAAHPGRVADLAVGRSEHGTHRLLQDQRQPPGGKQRFERPAVQETDDALLDQNADRSRNHESERHGEHQRIIEQGGIVRANHLLHHEGHIGADHHHLAVRHVDDAHDAEGDGKPDSGKQEDRAERQPVPRVLHRFPHRELVLYADDGLAGSTRNRCRRVGWNPSQQGQRVLVAARTDHRHRVELVCLLGVAGIEHHGGARLCERALHPGIRLLGDRSLERRQRARIP